MTNTDQCPPSSEHPVLFLFSTDPTLAVSAVAAGVDYIIVDWERADKFHRQSGTGFQIAEDTVDDVVSLARDRDLPVIVRINPVGTNTNDEVYRALEAGARGIMLPMARTSEDVQQFLELIPDGIKTLIQLETAEILNHLGVIRDLSWDFAHVGLNDLKLSRRLPDIWSSVLDGTVSHICRQLKGRLFGFGGITLVDRGDPIPSRLVMLEMARLECSMGVLRRSFTSDIIGRDIVREVAEIRRLLVEGARRTPAQSALDRLTLEDSIRAAGG